jgi:hypothetical protein
VFHIFHNDMKMSNVHSQVISGFLDPFIKSLGDTSYLSLVRGIYYWDFYFCDLGSLVVLSFPQPLSFYSVLPKPLSETLTRSSDGRNPV